MPANRSYPPTSPGAALLVLASLVVLAVLSARPARAETLAGHLGLAAALPSPDTEPPGFHLGDPSVLTPGAEPPGLHLFPYDFPRAPGPAVGPGAGSVPRLDLAAVPGLTSRPDRSRIVAGGFTALFLGLEYAAFWSSESLNGEFQFANEGWFGPTTYAGGADKASHVLGGYIAGRFLDAGLQWTGSPPAKSRFLSAAMIAVTGTLIEVGDAYHGFGFSWQDALLTAAGGVAGSVLAATGLDDTVTMRFGMVGIDRPDDPTVVISNPNHYSGEIYTLDVRMAGLFSRLGRSPGVARYLLASLTYGSKGYPWVEPDHRQRRLGFEIGLDTYEIGLALGLRPDTVWGAPILAALRYFRIPFTGIGVQYELNSRRWMGPNSFYAFDH